MNMSYDPIAAMKNDMRPHFPDVEAIAEQAIYGALGSMDRGDAILLREYYCTGSKYKIPQTAFQIARRRTDTVHSIEAQLHIALIQLVTKIQQSPNPQ